MKAEFIIPDDTKCRDALMEALRHASQTIDGGVLPVEAARKMASGLGDCYAFLQQDIAIVNRLGSIAGLIDEYDETSNEPVKSKAIESDIIEAIRDFVRLAKPNG